MTKMESKNLKERISDFQRNAADLRRALGDQSLVIERNGSIFFARSGHYPLTAGSLISFR